MTYTKVDRESTALGDMGLSYDEVAKGEYAEIDPVAKPKRKEKYIQYEVFEAVVGAYAEDLQNAYQSNESMETVLEEQAEELQGFREKFEATQKQLNEMMKAQDQLTVVEGLMATMEQQMLAFSESKELDQETMENMRVQIAEMESRTQEIDELKTDVEQILENLSSYFEDEGFPPLDSEEYDIE